jgi:hypothetical protein
MEARPRRLLALLIAVAGCRPDVVAPPNPPTVSALFDPTASPPVVPTPNDLAFVGGDGKHLNIVDLATDSPAQRDFNAYLRTLDGFPTSSTAAMAFSGPVDPTTVQPASASSPGSVIVVDTTTGTALDSTNVQVTASSDGTSVTVQPTQRWEIGHQFAVMIFGGRDPDGVKGANGEIVVASPTFFLLRAPRPLVGVCEDPSNPGCACPTLDDPSCHSIVRGVDDATALAAEAQRELVDAGLTPVLAATGRDRNNVVLFWVFTVTSQPTAVYDPVRGDVPFPNDVLIDQSTGLVNLPISPGDPQSSLKMQLNTLDGFSVSAPETATVELVPGDSVDPATLLPGLSTIMVNLDLRPGAEQPTFTAQTAFGTTLALTPQVALLPDQNRYAVLLTSTIHDTAGQPLEPPPVMVLLRGANPLFDGTHSTVNVLTDAQAQQLEPLRLALQPLIGVIMQKGLPREAIVLLWTFTTQSIARPLLAIDAFPSRNAIPTEVTIATVADQAALAAKSLPFPTANLRAMVTGTFTSEDIVDHAQSRILFNRVTMMPSPQADVFVVQPPPGDPPTTLKFWMSLPKTQPPGGAPVVILQHGLTSWRGDLIGLADDFAKAGFAAIAFDINFHGSRTACTADAQCASGPCNAGVCPGGLLLKTTADDALACSMAALTGDPTDCNPAASGAAFVSLGDPFMVKSNLQQYVVDAAQLVRVLRASGPNGLGGQLAAQPAGLVFDGSHITFQGLSLGAIEGAVFLSVDSGPGASVLTAGAAHIPETLVASASFGPLADQYLATVGIMRDTPQYAQLLSTFDWIIDGADPFAVGRFIQRTPLTSYATGAPNPPKVIIAQEMGLDTTIRPQFQAALSVTLLGPMGLDAMGHAQGHQNDGTLVSTYFPTAMHATLITGQPLVEVVPMRIQGTTFIATGGAKLPPSSN